MFKIKSNWVYFQSTTKSTVSGFSYEQITLTNQHEKLGLTSKKVRGLVWIRTPLEISPENPT